MELGIFLSLCILASVAWCYSSGILNFIQYYWNEFKNFIKYVKIWIMKFFSDLKHENHCD